ncbi:hypothetical protein ES708_28207 [subsurface metagenome]
MNEETKKIKNLLEKLSNAHGISGYEGNIREIIKKEVKSYVDEVKVDTFGNLIAIKKGKSPSVMLAAHMDEIGLMAKYIDDEGFIRFAKVGGWFDQTLVNQRVLLHTKKGVVAGVIGSKPVHVMESEEHKKAIEAKDMFIDVGAPVIIRTAVPGSTSDRETAPAATVPITRRIRGDLWLAPRVSADLTA